MAFWYRFAALLFVVSIGAVACNSNDNDVVVIYTSVDRHFSEPILQAFEKQTGIRVRALYDIEAAKTTGLANKLVAEKRRPRADIFWNSEFLQTQLLAQQGIFAPYQPNAIGWEQTQDEQYLWTSFGGRARVLIINTVLPATKEWPSSLSDFTSKRWTGDQLAIAHPLFGTSATHAAALYATWGFKRAADFFRLLKARGVRFVNGNSVVRDLAVSGKITFGVTDTDDACSARANGANVAVRFPDQEKGGIGTLVIPNTVALIAGAPHPETGKKLIDYLLSEAVLRSLAQAGWFHVSGTRVVAPPSCGLPDTVRVMAIKPFAASKSLLRIKHELRELLVN